MALTIDDTPSEYTREILQILKANEATATFFVIGDQIASSEDEEVLRDLILAGNELANHALHDEPSRSLSDGELAAQIRIVDARLQDVYAAAAEAARQRSGNCTRGNKDHFNSTTGRVEDNGHDQQGQKAMRMTTSSATTMMLQQRQQSSGRPPKYFRPGSGFFSSAMLRIVADLGYRLVLGDVYPHDPIISSWKINARHVLSMLRPGSIIVCHDRRQWTPPMLRHVLPVMKRRGYGVLSISELLMASQQT